MGEKDMIEQIHREKKRRTKAEASAERWEIKDAEGASAILKHNLTVAYMPKIDTHDAEQVDQRTMEYFQLCIDNNIKPSVAGYALALGVDRHTLAAWMSGRRRNTPEVLEVCRKAYSLLNANMEDLMQNNKINAVAGIFLMKNNMQYRDVSEVAIAPQDALQTPEQLIEQAKLLPDVED